jgi:hypothetical protein
MIVQKGKNAVRKGYQKVTTTKVSVLNCTYSNNSFDCEQSLNLCARERKQTYRTQYVTLLITNQTRGLEDRTEEPTEKRSETKLVHIFGASSLSSSTSTFMLQQTRPGFCASNRFESRCRGDSKKFSDD